MAKKRGNGEGTVFYDKTKKIWRGQIVLGYNLNGEAIRKSVSGKNKTEVRDKLKELIANNVDLNLSSDNITLEDWLLKWVEIYKKPDLSENSYKALMRVINLHLIPTLGNNKLKDLTTETIKLGYNRMFGDRNKYSQAFARIVDNTLRNALKQAVKDKYITYNPSIGATLPKVRPPRKVTAMNIEEQRKILQRWEEDDEANIFIFLLATGMRISEALGLTWDNVNLQKKEVYINKIMIEVSGNAQFKESAKTESGNRTIYLNSKAIEILERQLKLIEQELNFKNLVFPNSRYNFKGTANLRRYLKRTFIEAGVKPYPLHSLRHTYATRMVEKGVNIKFLQAALGHKNVTTTLQIYSDALSEFQRKQANEINIFD